MAGSDHEELQVSIRWGRRISPVVVTVLLSVTGAGGATYAVSGAEREKAEIDRRLAEQAAEAAEAEQKQLRERICVLERELTAAVSRTVSLSAADAEPSKARKAQAAARAVERFSESARDWPCPSTAQDFERRVQRPLSQRAANALPATVPDRR